MSDEGRTPEELRDAMGDVWVQNNCGFLTRYWYTANEALERVADDPKSFTEFRNNELGQPYVESVLDSHLEHHTYAGVLLAYANFDEFMAALTRRLGERCGAPITPNELRDRGVRRYRKFVHQVCRIPEDELGIRWDFLLDLSVVRHAIIHANGNSSQYGNPPQLRAVVDRHAPGLSFKHKVKLVVAPEFVLEVIGVIRDAALAVNGAHTRS